MQPQIFDNAVCTLGEGPLWDPLCALLFWADITGQRLCERGDEQQRQWDFDEPVSAAGWIDEGRLLVAGTSELWDFEDLGGGSSKLNPTIP